jgi:very-short-patch-repair endonuclease
MAKSIDCSIDKIKELKTSKSELENEWIEQQKLDDTTFKISPTYQGTFKEIASKIYDNTETYEWFTDPLPAKCTKKMLTIFTDLFTLSQLWKDQDVAHIEDPLPDCNSLVTPAQLDILKLPTLPSNSLISRETVWETILTKNLSELNSLTSSVLVYKEHLAKLLAFPTPLTKEVLDDELVSDKSKWISIYEATRAHIKADVIQQCYYLDHSSHFEYPSPVSLQQLYHDAKILHDFFKKGGTFANPIKNLLIPKEIKERRRFCSDVKVNGSDCDTLEEFEKVVLDLQHRINLSQLNEIWKSTIWESADLLCTGYKKFMDLLDNLTSMIQEISEMKNCLKILQSNFSIPQDKILDLNYFTTLAEYLGVVQQKAQKEDIEDRIEKSLQALQNPDLHPLSLELKQTLEKRDSVKYQDLLDNAGILEKERQDFVEYKMLLTRCREIFPQLSDDIVNQKITEKQIKQMNKAVDWVQAKNYMEKLLTPLDNNEIKSKIKDTERSIEQMIEKLVVDKSWLHLLHHLSVEDDLRKHLTSWMQYVKKIGKSESSKRSVKFRKLAQDEMTFCRGAIPCWIMPLYKVVETIKPTMGLFDFVIIDEASQLGPEAIFLLYMTKNIIIVGDDKQTSPEYIGITSDSMKPYKDKYLYDIPFREHFGTDFSLFDFGRILCNDTIVLREHFRCMPEIIEFCNQQWYKPNGYSLFPLRQYNENRLEPIRSVFVENAFIEGTGTFIRNTNEADRIVEVLFACLNDDKYEGKTFGVIALQGSAQAKYIEKKILESVDPREIEKRKLICGNSSDFQGDERDVIFLSLVTTRDHNRAPLTKAEDERRFNVAISRAKDQLWLFHSVQLEDLHNTDDLRYKLLHYMLSDRDINQQIIQEYPIPGSDPNRNIIGDKKYPKPFESLFEYEVFKAIRKQGYQVIPQYVVGKYRIDLVVVLRNGIKIAVECDGDSFHTDEQYYRDIVRQRELERCGWQFFRILASYFYVNPTKSLTPLWSLLSRNQDNVTGDVLSGVSPENDLN